MQGRIIKQISNQYTVQIDKEEMICTARGKFRDIGLSPLVGDIVEVDSENQRINEISPRKNELKRPVVANVDVALIVTSVKKPDLSLSLLDKQITIVDANNIKPIICLTKLDLCSKKELKDIKELIKYYKKIGIEVLTNKNLRKIRNVLKNKVVVLTGQTGAGKSSLLNRLDKSLNLNTSPISEALNRGVHTTRHTEIFQIGKISFVDTPGFSALDLNDVTIDALKASFKEFLSFSCAFSDCTHNEERDCGVKKALEKGLILPSRYVNYIRFLKEIYENSSKLSKK